MVIEIEDKERQRQGDYYDELVRARVEAVLAKWEEVEPFHFTEAEPSESTPELEQPATNLASKLLKQSKAKALLTFNIIKSSLTSPNKTTIISKETGEIISES